MILKPPKTQIATVARLTAGQHGVKAWLPEINERFRQVVKQMGYEWNGVGRYWYRGLDERSRPVADRLIETAAALYQAGFVVELEDNLAVRLQSGDWKPEQKRWVITAGDKLGLRWRGQDDRLYLRAQMLPESRWDKEHKAVTVPVLYFAEVVGFAEEHDFAMTHEAQAMLERAERDYVRTLLPALPGPVESKPKRGRQRFCNPGKFSDLPDRQVTTQTELYPHQVNGVEKLLPLRVGALFMDMGTGKTRCAIELAARRQARVSRVIWFCPVSLKITIAAEIAKHTRGESVHVFDDASGNGELPEAFWYVVGIESMSSSDRVVLAVNRLVDGDAFVIVDESSYIKGYASKRSMRIAEIGKLARYRLLLTGTPISQGVEDLYAQMRFLSPDILGYGSFYSFARNHLEYSDKYPGMIVRAHNVDHLAEKLAPYVYQVTKAECLDLPEKLYDQVYFSLTEAQKNAYEQAKWEILGGVELEDLKSYTIFKLFTALQQIVSGYWKREGELIELEHGRLEALKTVIGGIGPGEKAIIWCKFVHSVKQIVNALPGCAQYYGDLDEKQRDHELERFRGDDCRFLVATQATGGHGLTLNEAHYHVFYENEFKYSHRIQAEDRSHRIGQTQPVTYIDVVSNSGIDERIQKALAKKEDVVKAFRAEVKKIKDVKI